MKSSNQPLITTLQWNISNLLLPLQRIRRSCPTGQNPPLIPPRARYKMAGWQTSGVEGVHRRLTDIDTSQYRHRGDYRSPDRHTPIDRRKYGVRGVKPQRRPSHVYLTIKTSADDYGAYGPCVCAERTTPDIARRRWEPARERALVKRTVPKNKNRALFGRCIAADSRAQKEKTVRGGCDWSPLSPPVDRLTEFGQDTAL